MDNYFIERFNGALSDAIKYKSRWEFQKRCAASYSWAKANKLLDVICDHMELINKPTSYWTKERIKELAKNFTQRKEFEKAYPVPYKIASKNGWREEVLAHTKRGRKRKRAHYIYEFENGSAYVGLTTDYERRFKQHKWKKDSVVAKELKKSKAKIVRTNIWMNEEEAAIEEDRLIEKYRSDGWKIINIAKAGSIGISEQKWTKKTIIDEAKKYQSRKEFSENSGSAYHAALYQGILEDACSHMPKRKEWKGFLDKDHCSEVAKKYSSRTEFARSEDRSAYEKARSNGWLDEICSHMKRSKKPPGFWTEKRCGEEALKYKTRNEFRLGSPTAYSNAQKGGYLDSICNHMPKHNGLGRNTAKKDEPKKAA